MATANLSDIADAQAVPIPGTEKLGLPGMPAAPQPEGLPRPSVARLEDIASAEPAPAREQPSGPSPEAQKLASNIAARPPAYPKAPVPDELSNKPKPGGMVPTKSGPVYLPADEDIPVANSLISGPRNVAQGVERMAEPGMREKAGGLHQAIGGAFETATPAMLGSGLASPVGTLLGVGVTASTSMGTEAALKWLGLPDEYASVAGDLVGLVGGSLVLKGAYTAADRARLRAKIKPILQERLNRMYAEREAAKREAAKPKPIEAPAAEPEPARTATVEDIQDAEFEPVGPQQAPQVARLEDVASVEPGEPNATAPEVRSEPAPERTAETGASAAAGETQAAGGTTTPATGDIADALSAVEDQAQQLREHAAQSKQPGVRETLNAQADRLEHDAAGLRRELTNGRDTEIAVPGEQTKYPARYAVRELADLQPSHNPFSFEPNPLYAYQNDRDYSRSGAAARVAKQTSEFEPRFVLTDSPTAEHGAPIVDARGNVLGGNSRTMALARVYQRDGAGYRDALKQAATQFGIDPAQVEGMKQPVLVREIGGGVDAQRAITDFNKAAAAQLTPEERAVSDGRRMSDATVQDIAARIGDLGESGTLAEALQGQDGAGVVNALVKDGMLTAQEAGGYLDDRGFITPEGKSRIAKALVGRLFESPAEFRETAPEMRGKLERIAPQVLRVEGRNGWSLTPIVREAVSVLQDAKAHGIKNLDDLARQAGLNGETRGFSPEALAVAKTLQQNPNAAVKAFRAYASDEALSREGAAATFFEPPTREEAFRDAFAADKAVAAQASRYTEPYNYPVELKSGPGVYRKGEGLEHHSKAARFEKIDLLPRDAENAAAYTTNQNGIELLMRAIGEKPERSERVGGLHMSAKDAATVASTYVNAGRIIHRSVSSNPGYVALHDALQQAADAGKSLVLAVDTPYRTMSDRAQALREELDHALQAKVSHGGSAQTMIRPQADFFRHPLARIADQALMQRGYQFRTSGESACEIGVRLMASDRFRELGLNPAQARDLAAHYVRTLRGEYGREKPREIAKRVFAAFRGLGSPTEPGAVSPGAGPARGSGPSGGTGPNLSRYAERLGDESERDQLSREQVSRELGLFDNQPEIPGLADEVGKLKTDRDRLTGERLTAQFRAPVAREEQLRHMRRRAQETQTSMFEATPEEPQRGLFESRPEASVLDAIREAPGARKGVPVTLTSLRERFPNLTKEQFDKQVLDAADAGRLYLTTHDHGPALPEAQRAELVHDPNTKDAHGRPAYYVAATVRNPERGGVDPNLLTLGGAKFAQEDVVPAIRRAVQGAAQLGNDITRLVAPTALSKSADLTGLSLRHRMAQFAHKQELAARALRDAEQAFDRQTPEENYRFIDEVEHGFGRWAETPEGMEDLEPLARILTRMMDERRAKIQGLGEGYLDNFYRSYFPHIFERAESAGQFFDTWFKRKGARTLEGPKSFLKHREFPTFREALDAGQKPVTDNPVRLILMKAKEMDRFIMAHETLKDMASRGEAMFARTEEEVRNLPEGFRRVVDPIGGGHWYTEDGAAQVIDNFLSPSLGTKGWYRGAVAVNNGLNQAQLGLSGFHLTGEVIRSLVSRVALGIEDVVNRKPIRGSVRFMTFPVGPVLDMMRGSKVLSEYYKPGSQGAPYAAIIDALEKGGGRAGMPQEYATKATDAMMRAFRRGNAVGGAVRTPFAALEQLAKPIMEYAVPRLKLGAFFSLASDAVERLGPDAGIEAQRREMASIWDTIDDRFGQLVRENLFWNRTLSDLATLGVRAVGWDLGTLRTVIGGAYDAFRGGKIDGRMSHRLAYLIGLPLTVGLIGAMWQYLHTGKGPQEVKDYFFPKSGRYNKDGTPERVSMPTDVKDIYQYAHEPVKTLEGKASPIMQVTSQLLHNKDFLDRPISNSDDDWFTAVKREAHFLALQPVPISLRPSSTQRGESALNAIEREWVYEPGKAVEQFFGFRKAPADVQRNKPAHNKRRSPY